MNATTTEPMVTLYLSAGGGESTVLRRSLSAARKLGELYYEADRRFAHYFHDDGQMVVCTAEGWDDGH